MKLIDENLLDKIISEVVFENISDTISSHTAVSENLKKYKILTYYPENFKQIDPLNLYYNRYYWYLKFLISYQREIGYDAGLEQQEFKILEDGENITNVDWSEIEKISNKIKEDSHI